MKILVCTDGSKESRKALEEAAKLAGGCGLPEVAVIHVYPYTTAIPGAVEGQYMTKESFERFSETNRATGEAILAEAKSFFAEKNIQAKAILLGGHPAMTIAEVAAKEGYDIIVIGSRGFGGLKRLFLGSVSNAVLQEAKANVLIVK